MTIDKVREATQVNERRHRCVRNSMTAERRVARRDNVIDDYISGRRQRRVDAVVNDFVGPIGRRRVDFDFRDSYCSRTVNVGDVGGSGDGVSWSGDENVISHLKMTGEDGFHVGELFIGPLGGVNQMTCNKSMIVIFCCFLL